MNKFDISPLGIIKLGKYKTNLEKGGLQTYLKLAIKIIKSLQKQFHSYIIYSILSSDDTLSYIATEIMIADCLWDTRGSKEGYRKQRVVWAVKNFVKRQIKNRIFEDVSEYTYYDNPYLDYVSHEIIGLLQTKSFLDQQQAECLRLKYIEDLSVEDIATKLKLSRSTVYSNIKQGIKEIRDHYEL